MARALRTGDVLPAGQLAREHAHETGWEAVRLARPKARPWTAVRLPVRPRRWHEVVMFSRVTAGRVTFRNMDCDHLVLIVRGSR